MRNTATTLVAENNVVVVNVLDKIKWMFIDGIYYVHPDHVKEFNERDGPIL